MLYLDNAATSYEKPKEFYKAMNHCTKIYSVNAGRGGHQYSIDGALGIIATAEELCDLFGIDNPERIAFSQNATLSLNQAIGGILQKGVHAVITQMEHNSVLRPVNSYGNYTIVPADRFGRVSPADVEKAIRPDTGLVVASHASNVCGTVQNIAKIGEIAHKAGAVFLVDAAQTAGCKPIQVDEMNIDMLAFSAHKGLLGPLGVGGLFVREGVDLIPILSGGTGSQSQSLDQPSQMPDLLQVGTMNTPAIMALKQSIQYIKKVTPEAIAEAQRTLAFSLIERLINMEKVTVFGITDPKQSDRNGTVLLNVDGFESGTLCEILNNEYKIATRGGWHCAYPSHMALGTEKSGGLRVSFGAFSSQKNVKVLADAIYKISIGVSMPI